MIKLTNILQESDLGLTYKKGKTIKVTHKKSGKELIIIDKPNVRKEYEKIGFFVEGSCGYGIDGEVGDEPAGPHLIKKKKKKVDEGILNEAKYKQTYKSITARDKDSRRIWGSQIGHPRVKVTSWSEIEKSGRMKTAYIKIEGDKDWVDAYKKIAFSGKGNFTDVVKSLKESVNERMDKRQGTETLKQLGGNKFIAMTGAKDFGVGPKGMSFKIGRNSKRVNYIRIDLKNDLYNMEFMWVSKRGVKVVKKVKGVYNDQLQKVFTKYTGMYTRL